MAGKGNSRHMKRLAASPYSRIGRKTATYVAKPRPGRHDLENSIALLVVLRDKLGLASNAREARRIIRTGKIEVNGRKVMDEKYPVGFGDVIKLKPTDEVYEVGVGRKGMIRLDKREKTGAERTLKVVGKHVGTGSRITARLLDGSVLQMSGDVRVNDSVVVEGNKIKKILKFEQGARCLVIRGTHASQTGTVKEISKGTALSDATVSVESGDSVFETLVDNVMVIGE